MLDNLLNFYERHGNIWYLSMAFGILSLMLNHNKIALIIIVFGALLPTTFIYFRRLKPENKCEERFCELPKGHDGPHTCIMKGE